MQPSQSSTRKRKNVIEMPFPVWQALRDATWKKGMTSQQILLRATREYLQKEGFLSTEVEDA
jgi:hypothetical protein